MGKSEEVPIEEVEMSLIKSFVSQELTDIAIDASESVLDLMLEDGVIKNIPVFGTIYKFGKAGFGMWEQHFAKKVLKFLFELKDIDRSEREEFIKELEQKTEQRAGEVLLVLLDKIDNTQKCTVLAKLLKAKVNHEISIETFLRLGLTLQQGLLFDLKKLLIFDQQQVLDDDSVTSLSILGLLLKSNSQIIGGDIDDYPPKEPISEEQQKKNRFFGSVEITNLGKNLLEYGLK